MTNGTETKTLQGALAHVAEHGFGDSVDDDQIIEAAARRSLESSDEYNGWANRETWAASLHLSNDFGIYQMVNGWAVDARDEAVGESQVDRFGFYADGTTSVETTTVRNLADKLHDYIEDLRADISNGSDITEAERMMVLEIGSEWRVDWPAVATAWLDGFDFEGDDQ